MFLKSSSSRLAGSSALALVLLAGCSDNGMVPLEPAASSRPQIQLQALVTNVTWDFTGLLAAGDGCHEWGASKSIANGANGSIVATTGGGAILTSKGQELGVGDTERGLGLNMNASVPCEGDEVGDITPRGTAYTGIMFLNLNGVLPAGSSLTQIDLGSVQTAEGWKVSYSTTGVGGSYSPLSSGEGNGANNVGDNIVITGAPLPLPVANLALKFEKNTDASGNATTDNDYVVKSVTTSFDVPGSCTLTQGYWKTHSSFGPAPYDSRWITTATPLGASTLFFNTGKTWYQIYQLPPAGGNGFLQLAHQYMAAKLNILNGASSTAAVDAAILYAETYFAGKAAGVTSESNNALNNTLKTKAGILGAYNEGTTGPGHCNITEPTA